MRELKKKIQRYNEVVNSDFIKADKLNQTIEKSKEIVSNQELKTISYVEFIYQQSFFIKKKWWLFQVLVLLVAWFILKDCGEDFYIQRILGVGAPLFALLTFPEMWKNKKHSSIEIENTSYYSLRQIYSARIVLFSFVDIVLVTIFYFSLGLAIEEFVVNFVIPFNICCCISFKALCRRKCHIEHAVIGFMIWTTIWILILSRNDIYQFIVLPLWGILLTMSLAYLTYCLHQFRQDSLLWEEF